MKPIRRESHLADLTRSALAAPLAEGRVLRGRITPIGTREAIGGARPIEGAVPADTARYRIAMIAACPFPHARGTPIRAFRIAEALALRGHEVHVVTYHLGDAPPSVPFAIYRIPTVPTYRKLSAGPSLQKLLLLDPLLRRTLTGVLRRHPIDVVHAHHYEGLLVALSIPSARRPPVIYDAHTLLETELPYYGLPLGNHLIRAIGRRLDRNLPGRAAHVISVSQALRDRLIALGAVSADRVSVVGNGVEPSLFSGAPPARPERQRKVVFAGNLAGYQGIELLLEAFRDVARQRGDVRLELATGSPFAPYAQLVGDLGLGDRISVLRVGFDDLPAYLMTADVAVNPRLQCDGIPQKLLNYMACGCPIVSFEGSAANLRHGVTGWIVPGGDTAAMARAILRLLDDKELAQRLGAAAREEIRREHGWKMTARGVEAVYAQVLGELDETGLPRAGRRQIGAAR